MKKVLIITYYWPPSGGSGVQRWLKFTKYLPENGWQPYIFTPENPSFEVKDSSLEKDISPEVEVIKLPIWEPYSLMEKFKKKGQSQQSDVVKKSKKSFVNKAMLWMRGNLMMPDPRVFWVRPAVKVLEDLLTSNGIDTIITTGPPHSMHLIGLKLKKKLGVNWIADFRDPWTQWDLYDNFYLTKWARNKHKKLEHEVLTTADKVISVSVNYAKELEELGAPKVDVITNGFDAADFSKDNKKPPQEFVLRHVGLVDEMRDPSPMLEAIKSVKQEHDIDVKVEFIGNVNASFKEKMQSDKVLSNIVKFKPYVPHSEVLKIYAESAVLLLVLAHSQNALGNIPGKLFEYLASGRPILAIGNTEGDSAQIINQTGAGLVCDRADMDALKAEILRLYNTFKDSRDEVLHKAMAYSREELTKKLAKCLNDL